MHPIERLRFVARAGWAPPEVLASEAALALAALALDEPPALVPACRRLLAAHVACGPLWWVSAKVLTAADPVEEAERCSEALDTDPTADLLEELVQEKRAVRRGGVGEVASADVVVIRVDAIGPTGMVADEGVCGLVEAARALRVPIWLEAGVGRLLAPRLWEALQRQLVAERGRSSGSVGLDSLDGVERVVGPGGAVSLEAALAEVDCPEPPALLRPW